MRRASGTAPTVVLRVFNNASKDILLLEDTMGFSESAWDALSLPRDVVVEQGEHLHVTFQLKATPTGAASFVAWLSCTAASVA